MKKFNNIRYDTEENWNRAINFVPPKGELIVYDGIVEDGDYVVMPKFKYGDGKTKLHNLPFLYFSKNPSNVKYEDGILVFPEDK